MSRAPAIVSEHAAPSTLPALTVLQSSGRPTRTTNPYLLQLLDALPPPLRIEYFSMKRALFSRYDVFHVHWPEYLVRHRTRAGTWAKQAGMALVLLRLWAMRIPIVRTLHNLAPHEAGNLGERVLLRWMDRLTTLWIRINPATQERAPATVTILHGHYRAWYAAIPKPRPVAGRLLHFGLLRRYKGVETLLACMQALDDPSLSLRIVGNPASEELADEVRAGCRRDPRISARLEYVDDETLAREIGEAELVVLPYRQMHNSGTLLLSLSLDRPVLAPANDANAAIAAEVGPGWVYLYEGEIDASLIADTLARVRERDDGAPDLSARDWERLGQQHHRAYAAALRSKAS